jgi:hypothetical protein
LWYLYRCYATFQYIIPKVLELYFLYYSFLYIRASLWLRVQCQEGEKIDEEWTFVKGSRSRVLNLPRLF